MSTKQRTHSINISYFTCSNENTLSCIVSLADFAAKDKYNIKKEDTSGKGLADFAFLPLNPTDTAFILELKVSKSVDEALELIKSRDYSAYLAPYSGKKLAVAICYDADSEDRRNTVIHTAGRCRLRRRNVYDICCRYFLYALK